MKKIELNKRKTFYLIGIGGISMSALAMFLKDKGNNIYGSDVTRSETVKLLEKEKIEVDFTFCAEKIKKADYVVFSSAIKEDDQFLKFAMQEKKQVLCRGELLGAISKEYDKVIAVAGSHGKTTTTAMIYEILKAAGKNPTLHLGGFRCEDGKNFELGGEEFFVTEACEYHNNFLFLQPNLSVITNIEREHMDFFKTFENQLLSFEKFKNQSQNLIEKDDRFHAKNLRHKKNGALSFELYEEETKVMSLHLSICEDVNVYNCIYAYRACRLLGISDADIKKGLENFKGVKTRFEKMKCKTFENVICDYSHHPTEISKAIYSARKIFKGKKLVVIFQPHTYSRTKDLLDDFVSVLKSADVVILFKTYSARESPSEGLSARDLSKILAKENPNTFYADDFPELEQKLKILDKEAVLLFVGAGDLPAILHKYNFLS